MLLLKFTEDEIRAETRRAIESFERWARNMINETLTSAYGADFESAIVGGEPLIAKSVREHATQVRRGEPQRFKRWVDALFIDDIIYILCKKSLFQTHFKAILHEAYPLGNEQVRFTLNDLITTRNALSHSNPITVRQAERAICYSYDFVDCLKEYYRKMGKDRVWNVPCIVRAVDSNGNEFSFSNESNSPMVVKTIKTDFYVGDTYSLEIEVDSTFNPSDYVITWEFNHERILNNQTNKVSLEFEQKHIGELKILTCKIKSNKDWHRFSGYDHEVDFTLSVLPPA